MQSNSKSSFLLRNLFRGFIWLSIIIAVFILFKKFVKIDYLNWLAPVYENSLLIIMIFLISEIIFGIIPPEIFMIWALRNGIVMDYILIVGLLSLLSYISGVIGYFFGRFLYTTKIYRIIKIRFLRRTERKLHIFGPYLIIVAALTPIPFSGVSMLIGSIKYPANKFIRYSLFRFLRFAITALIIWEVNTIS